MPIKTIPAGPELALGIAVYTLVLNGVTITAEHPLSSFSACEDHQHQMMEIPTTVH